jgi:hypothetical protein
MSLLIIHEVDSIQSKQVQNLKRKGCSRFSKKEMDCFVVYGVLNTRQLHNKNSKRAL